MANIPSQPCFSFNPPPFSLPAVFSTCGSTLTLPNPPDLPTDLIPCCHFEIPEFVPPLPLPPLPGIGLLITALNVLIQNGLAAINPLQIPNCPL